MPFEFNPQQPSKPTEKSDKPSFDFGIDTSKPKTAASKPAGSKTTGAKKTNSAPKSEPISGKSGSKPSDSSGRGKQKTAPKNPFQDKKVMIFAGVGVALLLLIIVAIASNSGSSEPAPEQTVQKKLTPEEIRRERLRKLEAKYDAQYAAQQSGPKSEKQKLMSEAESKLKRGNYRSVADVYTKVHQMGPADGYPVSQLIGIYRNHLHDSAQVEKWEQVNNDIAQGNLDQLHKKSEEKYNKKNK